MAQDLLLQVDDLEVGGYSFKTIWLVNMGIDVLQRVQCLLNVLGGVAMLFLLPQDVRLQVKQGTRVLSAVNGALRNQLWRYRVQSFLN